MKEQNIKPGESCRHVIQVSVVGETLNGIRDSLDAVHSAVDAGLDDLYTEALNLDPTAMQGTVPARVVME